MLSIVALLLVAVVGGAGAFWAYKKYKQRQNQEYRYEGSVGTAKEGFDPAELKPVMLDETAMNAAIEKHKLVSAWGVAGEAEAKARLQEKFTVTFSAGVVKVGYQDKDPQLAKSILETVMKSYYERHQAGTAPATPSAGQ